MNKLQILVACSALLACASLSACTSVKIDPTVPPPSAEQLQAAKNAAKQANFDAACKYGGGVWAIAKPFALSAAKAKLGVDGVLAVNSLDVFVTTTCKTPLDISKADEITQRLYDIGGQVAALVIAAQSSP